MHSKTAPWKLFVDGAARNNPGPAAAGIYLTHLGQPALSHGFYLGHKTNNQAEYLALLIGLILVKSKIGDEPLQIISDSLLLVNQVAGIYQVKNPQLRILHHKIVELLKTTNYTIKHVLRAQNQHADALANQGVDERIPLPADLQRKLAQHEISI